MVSCNRKNAGFSGQQFDAISIGSNAGQLVNRIKQWLSDSYLETPSNNLEQLLQWDFKQAEHDNNQCCCYWQSIWFLRSKNFVQLPLERNVVTQINKTFLLRLVVDQASLTNQKASSIANGNKVGKNLQEEKSAAIGFESEVCLNRTLLLAHRSWFT